MSDGPLELPRGTDTGADAVRNAELRVLVHAARAQPIPTVTVEPEALHAAWRRNRDRRRARWGVGLAAAAVLALVVRASLSTSPASSPAVVEADEVAMSPSPPDAASGSPEPTPVVGGGASVPTPEQEPRPVLLADAIEVVSLDEPTALPELLDEHRVRIREGTWSIDSRASELVTVELPEGSLQLRGGHVHVEVAADGARVKVLREQVLRIHADGTAVTEPATSSTTSSPVPSADELAREAEQHLAVGRRGRAIKSLRRLVTLHPRSSAARSGLIDLGRLLEKAGEVDRARCAYALFLSRWSGHALSGDVTRAQRALGSGPKCRGLRPRG